jgi:hypothetical protein
MPPERYKTPEKDWLWPMPMDTLNYMYCMGYRQEKISLTKTYSMVYIKSQIPRNKGLTTKMLHVNGVSNADIIPSSVINSLNASYV